MDACNFGVLGCAHIILLKVSAVVKNWCLSLRELSVIQEGRDFFFLCQGCLSVYVSSIMMIVRELWSLLLLSEKFVSFVSYPLNVTKLQSCSADGNMHSFHAFCLMCILDWIYFFLELHNY